MIPNQFDTSSHNFWIILPQGCRNDFIKYMKRNAIEVNAHYQSLSHSIAGKKYLLDKYTNPVSVNASNNLIRLPLHTNLNPKKLNRICDAVLTYFSTKLYTPAGKIFSLY